MPTLRQMISTVEIEINSRCTRKCSYCPVSILPIPEVPKFMDDNVMDRVIDELVKMEFSGRLSYHFYNEPLIRRDLEAVIVKFKQALPYAYQVVYTNGELLTEARYRSLIDAGVDLIKVTAHDLREHPDRPYQIVQYPIDLELTNRGGVVTALPGVTDEMLTTACYAPSEMLIITVTGDVVLCYEDARREHVMGNLLHQSLEEIWFLERFIKLRELLAAGLRSEATSMCQVCTNVAHKTAGTSHIP